MGCACICKGIKLAVVGALLAINDQGLIWAPISVALLVGLMLIVLGALQAIWPCCPIHCKAPAPAKPAKKGR